MTYLMVSNSLGRVQCLVPSLLKAQGKIQVFRAKGAEQWIKSVQLLKDVCTDHHCTPARDTGMWNIILPSVYFAKPDRRNPPEDKIDPRAAPIVNQVSVMHETQLGLGLSEERIGFEWLKECMDKAGLYENVVIQEQQVRRTKLLDRQPGCCITAA